MAIKCSRKNMDAGFSPRRVMQITGVPYSSLNLWAKTGLVKPSIESGRGTGNERVYSYGDLVTVKVVFELRRIGISLTAIRKVLKTAGSLEHSTMVSIWVSDFVNIAAKVPNYRKLREV